MSLTTEESRLLEQYDTLPLAEQLSITMTIDVLEDLKRDMGHTPPGDDRAARLEAALIRYMIESRP